MNSEPTKYSKSLIKTLENKLKVGNLRSIHLNATVGRSRNRLDVKQLDVLEEGLSNQFLQQLTSSQKFSFNFGSSFQEIYLYDDEVAQQCSTLFKKLKNIHIDINNDIQNHGVNSFGFGYPMLVFRNPNNSKQLAYAPLFIWHLELDKEARGTSNWRILKGDDYPILINAQLRSYIESVFDGVQLQAISEEMLEDGIIDNDEILEVANGILQQLNSPSLNEIGELEKSTDKKALDQKTQRHAWVAWNGVFGLYKAQRESIIADLQYIHDNNEDFTDTVEDVAYQEYTTSSVAVDPSQERLLHLLNDERKLIIQGPPGTGKSQSLTAIITNALENNARCLVVCEKKTALEVLKQNLGKLGLDHLCAVIDDVNKDRKQIVDTVREIVDGKSTLPKSEINESKYRALRSKYENNKVEAQEKYKNSASHVLGDYTWRDSISEMISNQEEAHQQVISEMGVITSLYFTEEEYQQLTQLIENGERTYKKIQHLKLDLDAFSEHFFQEPFTQESRLKVSDFLKDVEQKSSEIELKLEESIQSFGDDFYEKGLQENWFFWLRKVFSGKLKRMSQSAHQIASLTEKLHQDLGLLYQSKTLNLQISNELKSFINETKKELEQLSSNMVKYRDIHDWKYFKGSIEEGYANKLIDFLTDAEVNEWSITFKYWYFNALLMHYEAKNVGKYNTDNYLLEQLDALTLDIQKHQAGFIVNQQSKEVEQLLKSKNKQSLKLLFNYRKNKTYGSKTSLRKIIHQEFDLFSTFFPVTMVNPVVCSSILPMETGLYDLVIFDEASQVRLEDAFAAMLRGNHQIISGDVHQMPPSSYFDKGGDLDLDEELEEADVALAESDSLLTFAKDSTFKFSYLDFHYRSQHPHLIDFSNAAFYGSRLIPMPNVKDYQPIKLHQIDGLYADRSNAKEAEEIINFIKTLDVDQLPTLGIATFNMDQRNLIWDHIYAEIEESSSFNKLMQELIKNGFFIKNLENIQGDERDVILLSTTFGKNEQGSFRQNFGQLNNQEKGYKLLNVIVTRAKKELHIFTSFPTEIYSKYASELSNQGNNGKAILYAYLAYARACSNQNEEERIHILNTLAEYATESSNISLKKSTTASLETQIIEFLSKKIPSQFTLIPSYKLGGLYLDIAIIDENKNVVLAIECDGKEEHLSKESYRYDIHRKNIMASHNIEVYHLWVTNCWQDIDTEINNIVSKINTIISCYAE
ncbi:DUF4011 domain-containing protein [Flammeovirga sp. MY04]|uniref:AAA domain-containing protein n=1 Tax=Flammeovirga sp. MY04 TaxID=1191459 RepID=UPI0008062F8A|nr:AAA domain-containing protein [Flammeovirga sp. MY04]ANQ52509.1 DUF4011 domain-containing protein [Flammeovirga sp. MY04]